jgi:hypothetical protein
MQPLRKIVADLSQQRYDFENNDRKKLSHPLESALSNTYIA